MIIDQIDSHQGEQFVVPLCCGALEKTVAGALFTDAIDDIVASAEGIHHFFNHRDIIL